MKDIMQIAEEAAKKNNYVRRSLEAILGFIHKIDAGQTVRVNLGIIANEEMYFQYQSHFHIATGKYDLEVEGLGDGYENCFFDWDKDATSWVSLDIPTVKAILAAMPEALEKLAAELEKIAGYELPEKLQAFASANAEK